MQQTWFKRSTRLLDDPRIFRLYIEMEGAGPLVPLLWEEVLAFNTDAGKDGILDFDDMFVLFIGRRLIALGEDADVLEKIIEGFIREDLVRQLPDDRFLITGWESWKPNKSEAERKAEYRALKERHRPDPAPSGPGAASAPPSPEAPAMSRTCPGHVLSDSDSSLSEEEVQEEEPAFDVDWWRAALTKVGMTPTKAILKSVRLSRLTPEEFSILESSMASGLLVWTLKEGRPAVAAALKRAELDREKAAAAPGGGRVVDSVEETRRVMAAKEAEWQRKTGGGT